MREVPCRLIDTPEGFVLSQAGADARIIGPITRHDLRRAETAFETTD
ncbi:MAG: hypothetical protein IPL39_21865 [Opitutaceae bacterium]|nr:hypothetical protein [Opitutaceae bacterium]